MNDWVTNGLILVWGGGLAYTITRISNLRSDVLRLTAELAAERKFSEATLESLQMTRDRLREATKERLSEEQALDLVQKITPLIEKTDWMTGRWSGQFDTLVRMEEERNRAITEARKALWSLPIVANYLRSNLPEFPSVNVQKKDTTK